MHFSTRRQAIVKDCGACFKPSIGPLHGTVFFCLEDHQKIIEALPEILGQDFIQSLADLTICLFQEDQPIPIEDVKEISDVIRQSLVSINFLEPRIHLFASADFVIKHTQSLLCIDSVADGFVLSIEYKPNNANQIIDAIGRCSVYGFPVNIMVRGIENVIALLNDTDINFINVPKTWDINPLASNRDSVIDTLSLLDYRFYSNLFISPPGTPCGLSAMLRTAAMAKYANYTQSNILVQGCLCSLFAHNNLQFLIPFTCPYSNNIEQTLMGCSICETCLYLGRCIACPVASSHPEGCLYKTIWQKEQLIDSSLKGYELFLTNRSFIVQEHDWDYQYEPPSIHTRRRY